MDSKTISAVKRQIYRQFPEVNGEEPSIRAQASAKSAEQTAKYLITFKGRIAQTSGPTFNRSVRVVADDNGRILKVTTSR